MKSIFIFPIFKLYTGLLREQISDCWVIITLFIQFALLFVFMEQNVRFGFLWRFYLISNKSVFGIIPAYVLYYFALSFCNVWENTIQYIYEFIMYEFRNLISMQNSHPYFHTDSRPPLRFPQVFGARRTDACEHRQSGTTARRGSVDVTTSSEYISEPAEPGGLEVGGRVLVYCVRIVGFYSGVG